MALLSDIGTYLVGAGLGLTIGSTGNLFLVPFPEQGVPDSAVCLVEYAGLEPVRAMGANLADPVADRHRFQVLVRDALNNFATARALSQSIYEALDEIGNTSLSGTNYLVIRALQPPMYIGEDDDARHRFAFNVEVYKARSTS